MKRSEIKLFITLCILFFAWIFIKIYLNLKYGKEDENVFDRED